MAPGWQIHGWTCAPANTGPPIGWFVIVIRAPRPSSSVAVTTLGPFSSPSISPTPSLPNLPVTSRSPTLTLNGTPLASGGRTICTSASPPEITSARLDSTSIRRSPDAACAGAENANATSTTKPARIDAVTLTPDPNTALSF